MLDEDVRDGSPGWLDSLLAGRSRADYEVERDAAWSQRIFAACVLLVGLLALVCLFSFLDLRLGTWALPVFVPAGVWMIFCAWMREAVRPWRLAELRGGRRLAAVAANLVVLWVLYPVWAGPAAAAWAAASQSRGDWSSAASLIPPFGAVIAAAPFALGLVSFVVLLLAMMITPASHPKKPRPPLAPPSQPETLRGQLLDEHTSPDEWRLP